MYLKKLWAVLPLLALSICQSCSSGSSENHSTSLAKTEERAEADTTNAITSAQSTPPLPDQKIIRTADFNCKVQNVFNVVTQLEQTVLSMGGAIEESNISNTNSEITSLPYKTDSLRQIQTYTTTAQLTLRVPVQSLDKMINTIPGLVSFIDSRTIRQTNATFQYLLNDLKNNAAEKRLAQNINPGKNPNNTLQIRQYTDNREEQNINRKIENLKIIDNVTYATLTIALSQPEQVYAQIVTDTRHITRIPFTTQLTKALSTGWEVLIEFAIGLITAWPLLLLLTFIIMLVRRYRNNKYAKMIRVSNPMG